MNAITEAQDLASISEAVLNQAIDYCTQKVQVSNSRAVIDRLRAGDDQVREYTNYSLAKQVAASLGALDENVKAAYVYDYESPGEDFSFDEAGRAWPIHMIVWAKRKTAALNAVVETWDRALTQRYAEIVGGQRPSHMLDVQVVDSTDVAKRIGYGTMLSSLHHPPTEVWKR